MIMAPSGLFLLASLGTGTRIHSRQPEHPLWLALNRCCALHPAPQ